MVENRRVLLERGKQRELILKSARISGSVRELSKHLEVPHSTMKNYCSEVSSLPEDLFKKLAKVFSTDCSRLKPSYKEHNWGSKIGGRKGMASLEKKYPKKLAQWRKEGMRRARLRAEELGYPSSKKINEPELDNKLAEFVGVYLGDGTFTKYFIRISGDGRYDFPYFNYLSDLIFDLFGVRPTIKREKGRNTINLIISSKRICDFMKEKFRFKYGHKIKNKSRIPLEILKSEELSLACLRGLVDTDGSISRRGKNGSQFCLHFSSYNETLLKQVKKIGKDIGVFTYFAEKGAGTNKFNNLVKYFELVGSSNLRHIVRYNERLKGNTIYVRDVIKYYGGSFYKAINLPFKPVAS